MSDSIGIFSISGYNFRGLLAFCRFARSRQRSIHLWAKDSTDPVFLTDYRRWVFATRESRDLDLECLIETLKKIKTQYGYKKILILPITEYFNRFILTHRNDLEEIGAIIPLVDLEVYETLSDKIKFRDLCREHGLEVPPEVEPVSGNLPLVAKPARYDAQHPHQARPVIFKREEELNAFTPTQPHDFFYQKFLIGESYYLFYSIGKDGSMACASQQNMLQQYGGRSIIAAQQSALEREKICGDYLNMLRHIGFFGLIMIEVMKTETGYAMIEANPRIWGPTQLIVDGGGELLLHYLRQYHVFLTNDHHHKIRSSNGLVYYFWSGGIIQDAAMENYVYFHKGNSERKFFQTIHLYNTADVYMRTDSFPLYLKESHGEFQ